MEHWCWLAERGFSMRVVLMVLGKPVSWVAGFWSQCVGSLLLPPGVGFPGWRLSPGVRLPVVPRFPESWLGVDFGPC